jgi:hypothetical protein
MRRTDLTSTLICQTCPINLWDLLYSLEQKYLKCDMKPPVIYLSQHTNILLLYRQLLDKFRKLQLYLILQLFSCIERDAQKITCVLILWWNGIYIR